MRISWLSTVTYVEKHTLFVCHLYSTGFENTPFLLVSLHSRRITEFIFSHPVLPR
jgi:hypothetical protein